jgi:hypothetical protein
MQRYIISERRGVDGLRLENDVEVPQLKGPNDVSTTASLGIYLLTELDPNQYQSSFPQC